jgi:Caspase domain
MSPDCKIFCRAFQRLGISGAVLMWLARIFLVLAAPLLIAAQAYAETRIALVIGNAAYKSMPQLANPTHDATALHDALTKLGFDADLGLDLTRDQMDAALIKFARKARQADVALVFFGGHGLQYRGVNYLAPIDAEVKDEADFRRLPTAQQIVEDLQAAKNIRILILDACRDNSVVEHMKSLAPSSRAIGVSRGLGRMEKAEGTLIAFSTQPDTEAADGSGYNSPFIAALLNHMPEPGLDVRVVFARARADVYAATRHEQLPELSDSLVGEFSFKSGAPVQPPHKDDSPTTDIEAAMRADFAAAKQIDTVAAWDAFLQHYPSGLYADLARAARQKLQEAMLPHPQPSVPPQPQPSVPPQPQPSLPPQPQQDPARGFTVWDHNGSRVILKAHGAEREFYYDSPRPGMLTVGARKGTLLFSGQRTGNAYSGVAYVFNKKCGPHAYDVSGSVSEDQRSVTMFGKAPSQFDDNCKPIVYKDDTLVFTFTGQ